MSISIPKGRYVVLGSSGLVGTHALEALKDVPGVNVRAVYHKTAPVVHAGNIEIVKADLTHAISCAPLFSGMDYALMFAGIVSPPPVIANDPIAPAMQTLHMTMHCLEAAYLAKIKKFVWLSSTVGYPSVKGKLKEAQMFEGDPPDVYYSIGWATRYLEILCRLYSQKLKEKMTVITLRPTMIYGEYGNFGEAAHFLPTAIRKVVEKPSRIEISGQGNETRDFIYAKDVVRACFLALAKIDRYEAINIAAGKSITINDLLETIMRIEKVKAEVAHGQSRPQSEIHRTFDNTKAADLLGFTAETSIEEGLKKTISWYKKNLITQN